MNKKKSDDVMYITMRVSRPLTKRERDHIESIENHVQQEWEHDRYSLLFEIAVLAKDEKQAVKMVRKMLQSPELVIVKSDRRKGEAIKDVEKIPSTKSKG